MFCSTRNTIRITGNTARIVFIATAGRCFRARISRTTDWTQHSPILGRYNVTQRAGDEGKFAVPSLRNVAVTAPYMHDGRFKTLEEVVEHYCTGMKRSADAGPESRQASRRRRAVERGRQTGAGGVFENAHGRKISAVRRARESGAKIIQITSALHVSLRCDGLNCV